MDQNQASKTSRSPFITMVCDFFEILLFSVLFVMLIFNFVARLSIVSGTSMNRTLDSGDRVITSGLFYEPEAGDIIVFHQTGDVFNELMIKRIIATEGQYVLLDWDAVYVSDDDIIDESDRVDESGYAYIEGGTMNIYPNSIGKVFQVPEGHVFVMGDNRYDSTDSRSPLIGFVDERQILGKVLLRVTPLSKFGAVN